MKWSEQLGLNRLFRGSLGVGSERWSAAYQLHGEPAWAAILVMPTWW